MRYLLIALLLLSCSKKSELKKDMPGVMLLIPQGAGVESADPVSWAVGPDLRQNVHKGVRLVVRFPNITDEDLKFILKKSRADAWLVKVTKKGLDGRRTMGIIELPLYPMNHLTGGSENEPRAVTTATFNIFYADASPSIRFEKFNCPAFGTHKVLDDVTITRQDTQGRSTLSFSAMDEERLGEKILEFNYYSTVFNGGMELTGEYIVEIALYERDGKRRASSWLLLPEVVDVAGEHDKPIKGCNEFKIPPKKEKPSFEGFKFKREEN